MEKYNYETHTFTAPLITLEYAVELFMSDANNLSEEVKEEFTALILGEADNKKELAIEFMNKHGMTLTEKKDNPIGVIEEKTDFNKYTERKERICEQHKNKNKN